MTSRVHWCGRLALWRCDPDSLRRLGWVGIGVAAVARTCKQQPQTRHISASWEKSACSNGTTPAVCTAYWNPKRSATGGWQHPEALLPTWGHLLDSLPALESKGCLSWSRKAGQSRQQRFLPRRFLAGSPRSCERFRQRATRNRATNSLENLADAHDAVCWLAARGGTAGYT